MLRRGRNASGSDDSTVKDSAVFGDGRDFISPDFNQTNSIYNSYGLQRINVDALIGASAFDTVKYKSSHVDTSVYASLVANTERIKEKFAKGEYDAQTMPLIEALLDEYEKMARIQIERNKIDDCRKSDIAEANKAAFDAVNAARNDREKEIERLRLAVESSTLPSDEAILLLSKRYANRLKKKVERDESREEAKAKRAETRQAKAEKRRVEAEQRKKDRETKRTEKQQRKEKKQLQREERLAAKQQRKESIEKQKLEIEQARAKADIDAIAAKREMNEVNAQVAKAQAEHELRQSEIELAKAEVDLERAKTKLEFERTNSMDLHATDAAEIDDGDEALDERNEMSSDPSRNDIAPNGADKTGDTFHTDNLGFDDGAASK